MSEPIAAFDTSERRAILNNMVDREHPAVQAIMKLVEENRQLRLVIAGLTAVTVDLASKSPDRKAFEEDPDAGRG